MPSALVESVVVSAAGARDRAGPAHDAGGRPARREKDCYKLALSSNVDAKRRIAFYESLGFERYGYSFRLDPPFATDGEPLVHEEVRGIPLSRVGEGLG